MVNLTESRIVTEYRRRTPTSERLAREAQSIFPSGITHDARYLLPYPIYVARAAGSRKWDVDGNEYVDYTGGHGALLLGHNHPAVMAAVEKQLPLGTHYGASHELEIRWGRLVQQLIPSAETVRFTNSGTEATLLALRLVRAHTGRRKIMRFTGHFHGWQDHVAFGSGAQRTAELTPGILPELADNTVLMPAGDIGAVRARLAADDEIAGVILEPTGASWGKLPVSADFVAALREATAEHDVPLVFDEVISGFRCSPGGAQGHYGITPDLTALAKILAGGFPGGAIVGRSDIMRHLAFAAQDASAGQKIPHHGTYNANPISAAAGVAALETVSTTDACGRANDYAARLRDALNGVARDLGAPCVVYGTFSGFHVFLNVGRESITADDIAAGRVPTDVLAAPVPAGLARKFRLGLLTAGVEILSWPGAPTSAVHTDDDLEHTAEAFRRTMVALKDEGDL